MRLFGALVAAVLLTVAAFNVPWRDELVLRPAAGEASQRFVGQILGDWKALGGSVRFRFNPGQEPHEDSPLNDSGLASVALLGGELEAKVGQLLGRPWSLGPDGTPLEGTGEPITVATGVEWRPGLPRAFRELDLLGILPALGLIFLCSLLVIIRWWRLLAILGCPTTLASTFRLTYVGLFFNVLLPGNTGGDLVRAYVVVRGHPERRANALVSVVADRALGLLGMVVVASIAIQVNDERFAALGPWVLAALGSMLLALAAFASPTLRRLVRFDRLLTRLPQGKRLAKLDEALRSLAEHPGTLLLGLALSCANHISATAAIYFLGHSFGDGLAFLDYICIVTVANTLTSVPISPGGLGVGEVLFGTLFRRAGGLFLLGVATSFTYRLLLMCLGVFGGLMLLLPGGAAVRRQFAEEREAAQDDLD